jgi:hypothetical protein
MTTTARPAPGQHRGRTPRVLRVAGACVVVAVLLTAVVAGVASGRPGALGALVGGGIACAFFLFGSAAVNTSTRVAPEAAMLTALMTYTLQVALVALAFAALKGSGAVGTTLSSGWLAGGVVAATVAWVAGQMVGSARARVPAYDIELPGPAQGAADAASQGPSRPREVGAP